MLIIPFWSTQVGFATLSAFQSIHWLQSALQLVFLLLVVVYVSNSSLLKFSKSSFKSYVNNATAVKLYSVKKKILLNYSICFARPTCMKSWTGL